MRKIVAYLCIALSTVALLFILLELGANYFLLNVATTDQFNRYASIRQITDRYGQDFLVPTDAEVGGGFSRYYPHPYLGYVMTPNWVDNRKADEPDMHNSFGFRGAETTREKPEGVYRIVTLGSSVVYGSKVAYDMTYPHQLQTYLNENSDQTVEVINMAVPAYTSHEWLMTLQFRTLDFDPDLIIVYGGGTDIHARLVSPPEAYVGDNTGYRAPNVQDTVMVDFWEHSTLLRILGVELEWIEPHVDQDWNRWTRASTAVGDEYRDQIRKGTYPSGVFETYSAMELLDANPPIYFERNVRNIALLADAYGSETLFVSFVYSTEFDDPQVTTDVYQLATEQHNEVFRQVADDTNSYFFDLVPLFPNDASLFHDGRHMLAEGNRLRSQFIGDYIIENIFTQDIE